MKVLLLMLAVSVSMPALGLAAAASQAADKQNNSSAQAAQAGAVHVPAFDLPLSGFLSANTRAVLERQVREGKEAQKVCPFYPPLFLAWPVLCCTHI